MENLVLRAELIGMAEGSMTVYWGSQLENWALMVFWIRSLILTVDLKDTEMAGCHVQRKDVLSRESMSIVVR